MSLAERARSLEIRCKTFAEARSRMHNTNHDLAPEKALADGCYMYSERKTRSDATNPEVMALARLYWHSDDVSRPTGRTVGGVLRCAAAMIRSLLAYSATIYYIVLLRLTAGGALTATRRYKSEYNLS